jgi:hypothetical protein
LYPAGKVELERHDMDLASRESGCPDQLVNIDRTWAQRADDRLTLARADVAGGSTVRSSSAETSAAAEA